MSAGRSMFYRMSLAHEGGKCLQSNLNVKGEGSILSGNIVMSIKTTPHSLSLAIQLLLTNRPSVNAQFNSNLPNYIPSRHFTYTLTNTRDDTRVRHV